MTAPTTDTGTASAEGSTPAADTTGGTTAGAQGPAPRPGGSNDGGSTADGGSGRAAERSSQRARTSSRDDDAPDPDAADHDDRDDRGAKAAGKDWRVEDLPEGAQKLIADLRKEAGTRRTEAGEAKKAADSATKAQQATDEKFASAVEAFTKALGLTPDTDDAEPRSPEELLGEVTTKYQQKTVELAVYRAAAEHGADPEALLDSRGFLTRAFGLDPAADDFDSAIGDAIGAAVESNPKLRAAVQETPAAPSGGDFGGGPAERIGPDEWTVDDFRRERQQARNGHAA